VVRPTGAGADQLVRLAETVVGAYRKAMDTFALNEGAAAAYRLIDATNEYIAATAPWNLAKDAASEDRLTQVLFDAAEAIRLAAVLLEPIMPTSCREILRRVGAEAKELNLDRDGRWRTEGERVLAQAGPLWPRKETVVSDTPLPPDAPAPGAHPAPAAVPAPASPERISIDDFMKVELRVAKVLAAERVPKSSKLLKLQVDAGAEHRTIVAGIAEAYEPEALVGRTVVIVFNLRPAKLMGVESNGMVLAASPEGGGPLLVGFEQEIPPGTRVR
jgi:methionyl-tRNA synthetase